MVDTDRAQVYAAEVAAFEGTTAEEIVPFHQVVALSGRVMSDPWWPVAWVEVRRARADAMSSSTRAGCDVVVRIADPQMTPATLVHELAHVLAGAGSGHGPLFRRAHVDVATVALGAGVAGWLTAAYAGAGLPLAERPWAAPPTGAIAL